MSAFDLLHVALQHHIVNSLGWRTLRPLQEQAIAPLLAGHHALLLAPTAGGKTEAALFPVFSRQLSEHWRGLSVVYICPIKALLNNLEQRLSQYADLLGRRVALWHGDIADGQRQRIRREPPDILLTTPESLEVMLVSQRVDHRALFANLRTVIVDELHAFAGDDRGWHLLAVIERLTHLAERPVQRIGLSATVGNPQVLLDWLCASDTATRQVIGPSESTVVSQDVQLDYVGSLENAALVISRLHRGEKRLVFCDSRSRVEQLATALRSHGVKTYVSHSSLSVDARRQAETAFAEAEDCVIVATSTLELGLDVGDLDRVIQIDAPYSVASFLQRMGRTGRRPGTERNCLFLATKEDAFLRASALLRLWSTGYVEPISPPSLPYHVFAQQLLALALQETGIGRALWRDWIGQIPVMANIPEADLEATIQYMLDTAMLFEDEGLLCIGTSGETTFGRKHFLELFSVFSSPPLITVWHGRSEVGQVHDLTFYTRGEETVILTLGGRNWAVRQLDWARRKAYVEPVELPGRSRWVGVGQPLSFPLCRAAVEVLSGAKSHAVLSQRAQDQLSQARAEHPWLTAEATTLVQSASGEISWWTFAGQLFNDTIGERLGDMGIKAEAGNYALTFSDTASIASIQVALRDILAGNTPQPSIDGAIEAELKFSECLPPELIRQLFLSRLMPDVAFDHIRQLSIQQISLDNGV